MQANGCPAPAGGSTVATYTSHPRKIQPHTEKWPAVWLTTGRLYLELAAWSVRV